MIKAIIFDCFGVLIGKGFAQTYTSAGGDARKDRLFIEDLLGQANLGLISENDFHSTLAAHLNISIEDWFKAVVSAELPDEQLFQYIEGLRPRYKTAILSNSNRGVILGKLGRDRLNKCFDEIVVSADVGLVKPDLRIYELTANKLNVGLQECVFIDDIQAFINAAQKLGMATILYRDFDSFKHQLEKLTA